MFIKELNQVGIIFLVHLYRDAHVHMCSFSCEILNVDCLNTQIILYADIDLRRNVQTRSNKRKHIVTVKDDG